MQRLLVAMFVMALGPASALAEQLKAAMFKQPYCGCCDVTPIICARMAMT
jgi:hypothetical protein